MSRSIGGRWFTTLSPISTSPAVIDSRPATMRRLVVLPHPEGPTSTTNSLSWISRLTPFTAWAPSSYRFSRLRRRTRAIGSPFHGAGDAGDVVLDEEGIDQRHRDRAQERPRHQRAPEEDVAADQLRG